jgi:hypothetical protein
MGLALNMVRDSAGDTTFGLPFSDFKYDTTLLTGVEQTLTIPGDHQNWLVIFSIEPGTKIWTAKNATATIPGAAFATTDSELNPVARKVKAADVLHFITNDANAELGITLYAI